jgi:hypothetical protein
MELCLGDCKRIRKEDKTEEEEKMNSGEVQPQPDSQGSCEV